MKKRIFYVALLFSSFTNAQSLTQLNEPVIGNSATMFVCDSSFSNFSSTSGTGLIWDFSSITGYTGISSKVINVSLPDVTDFSPATKMTKVDGFISTYWNSSTNKRTSNGFVFTEPSLGKVVVKFSTNDEVINNYPFAYLDNLNDVFSGSLQNTSINGGIATNCTGTNITSIDGVGTLKLPNSNTFANVIRQKTVETTTAKISYLIFTSDVIVTRTQFDYFNTSGSTNLPIFSHINIVLSAKDLAIEKKVTLVISSVNPTLITPPTPPITPTPDPIASLEEVTSSNFSIYPNPTEGNITIIGNFSPNASLMLLDHTGRKVTSVETLVNETMVDLSSVNKGIYQLVIMDEGVKMSRNVIVK